MSFMFKPLAYDEPNAKNNIELNNEVIDSLVSGNENVISTIVNSCKKRSILCLDGYVSAQFNNMVADIKRYCIGHGTSVQLIDMASIYKSQKEIEELTKESLPLNYNEDPVLLFGKLYKGNMSDFVDFDKLDKMKSYISETSKDLIIIYGMGSAIKDIREIADYIAYVDITPKVAAIRAREKKFVNIGDENPRPFNLLMRRNYFVDFEVTLRLRKELLSENLIDFYILGSNEDYLQMFINNGLNGLLDTLVKYPFRAKPVYLEGIWGGEYIRKIRNIPMNISDNVAWIFEFIPMEVSIEVYVGREVVDIPFYTFVQKKGLEMMGEKAYVDFEGYFPIRFNYDDTWHSDGNMSIQVHPDEDFIIEHYNEFGRQDEAYYVIATGHGAKTYAGWCGDGEEFLKLAKKSEKTHININYQDYINAIESVPGRQIMIPAGTIHASGQNQLILELGSLTIGSYTYKIYDYNRRDSQGNVRPIHTANAQKVLNFERNKRWVNENLAIEPILVDKKEDYAEYIIGKTELMYYQTNRIEIKTHGMYQGSNNGQFTVLTLVDGEEIKVYSKSNPEFSYTQKYLDIITIPATIHDYVIEAKGYQPVVVHKTFLRENYNRYKNVNYFNR